ncbi:glycosyltransferase family 4 protein [Leifsonia sp. TF02-11]|uniref:glycosyltransferase family 4 protein n=1 Tax=Leifsonia sp. TF02-11 TaxID=2815212 RepID=UPI001AA0B8EF|nr:glycosyltransferase family 4 protein [Leifsonia sp. TF02-11]MBO1740114.1 glycosyltransferase family 4 protein [Leifsonia sp. TF02-11]
MSETIGGRALRVMQVIDNIGAGGAQQVVVDLSNWLALQHGVVVSVVAEPGSSRARLAPSVRFIPQRPTGFLRQTRALLRAARAERPDVLHAHQRREALQCLIAGRLLGIPVVEHAHTRLPSIRPRILSFRSRMIFAVGGAVADMVVYDARRPRSRVVVVGNAPAQRHALPPREWPSLDATAPVRILAVGRLVEQKDPLRFVRVVAAVAKTRPVAATWAGDGELRADAEGLAAAIGAPVEFVGQVDDVPDRLDSAHALVMTSRWEGTPLVVLEAFERRRPVVATTSAANGLLASGRGIVVADDADDDEFADAIVHVLTDDPARTTVVAAAKSWVDAEASPDRVFGPVIDAYRSLAGRRVGR